MGERRFSASAVIDCAPEAAFAWVADHRHVGEALEGVSRWRPLGRRTRGIGARFDVAMNALGFPLENVLVLDEWEEPRSIGWRSESGLIKQVGRWTFEQRKDGTRVTLAITYTPPLGPIGSAVAARLDQLVRRRLERALQRMRAILEDG